MTLHRSLGDKIVDAINIFLLSMLIIITLYPVYFVIVSSLSHPVQLFRSSSLIMWPRGFSLDSYRIVFTNRWIYLGYRNTLMYVTMGASLSLFLTFLGGYVLSRKYLPGRGIFLSMIIFTMFFSGGMIPTWILVDTLGMRDTIWAMILPGAMSTFNLIVMKTFLQNLPDELEESARIDGANDWTILWRIVAPLSTPALAVVGLFYIVAGWNSFMPAMLYLRDRNLLPLQVILREILLQNSSDAMNLNFNDTGGNEDFVAYEETVKHASIIVTTVPILCVYPFLQKYFVKGLMIGAIKG